MKNVTVLVDYIKELKLLDSFKLAAKYKHPDILSIIVDVVFSDDEDNPSDTQQVIYNFRKYFNVNSDFKITEFLGLISDMSDQDLATKVFKSELMTKPKGGVLRAKVVREWAKILLKYNINHLDDVMAIYAHPYIERDLVKTSNQNLVLPFRQLLRIAGDDMFVKVSRYQIDFINDAIDQIVEPKVAFELLTEATNLLKQDFPLITLRDLDFVIFNYMDKPLDKRPPNEIRNLKRPPKRNKIVKVINR
jgi:hypothetical protein